MSGGHCGTCFQLTTAKQHRAENLNSDSQGAQRSHCPLIIYAPIVIFRSPSVGQRLPLVSLKKKNNSQKAKTTATAEVPPSQPLPITLRTRPISPPRRRPPRGASWGGTRTTLDASPSGGRGKAPSRPGALPPTRPTSSTTRTPRAGQRTPPAAAAGRKPRPCPGGSRTAGAGPGAILAA